MSIRNYVEKWLATITLVGSLVLGGCSDSQLPRPERLEQKIKEEQVVQDGQRNKCADLISGDTANQMRKIYEVGKGRESLVARLVEDDSREVELIYTNAKGDRTRLTVRNGMKVFEKGHYANGMTSDHGTMGYLVGLEKLGPELRKQLPLEWRQVLGSWFAPKSE